MLSNIIRENWITRQLGKYSLSIFVIHSSILMIFKIYLKEHEVYNCLTIILIVGIIFSYVIDSLINVKKYIGILNKSNNKKGEC